MYILCFNSNSFARKIFNKIGKLLQCYLSNNNNNYSDEFNNNYYLNKVQEKYQDSR